VTPPGAATVSPRTGEHEPPALREWFAARARELDRGGADVRDGLRALGRWGLLDLGAPGNHDGALTRMAAVVEQVSSACLSSGFAVWAQRMVIEYLARAAEPSSALPALRAGTVVGATAMAPAMRDVAGLEPVPVRAQRGPGGFVLTGPIRWASNLFPGALVVFPARLDDGRRIVVTLRTTDSGVRVAPPPDLVALNATASSSIALDGAEVSDEAVLSDDLAGFVRGMRPTFLLLQTAFCAGLAGESLDQARARLTGLNACFAEHAGELHRRHDAVRQRLFDLAGEPEGVERKDLLRLRLDAATLATEATRLEATVRGGPGYLADSATGRRLREAAFLPIQAPTEGELRWELSRHE
jgi:alkylation response protein AidB-like acyl-CoA dehydrogenase